MDVTIFILSVRDRQTDKQTDRQTDRQRQRENLNERERQTERASMKLYQSGQNQNLPDSYLCYGSLYMLWFAFSSGGSWNEGWWVGTFGNYKTDDLHTYGCVVSGEALTGTEIPGGWGGWGGGRELRGGETKPDVHYHHHDESSMARGRPRGCVHNPQLWKRGESHSDDSFMVRGRPRGVSIVHSC